MGSDYNNNQRFLMVRPWIRHQVTGNAISTGVRWNSWYSVAVSQKKRKDKIAARAGRAPDSATRQSLSLVKLLITSKFTGGKCRPIILEIESVHQCMSGVRGGPLIWTFQRSTDTVVVRPVIKHRPGRVLWLRNAQNVMVSAKKHERLSLVKWRKLNKKQHRKRVRLNTNWTVVVLKP